MKLCAKCGEKPRHNNESYCHECAKEIWRAYKKGKSILTPKPKKLTRAEKIQLIKERHELALQRKKVPA